jgi:Tol biopolymer transport system component
MSVRHFLVLTFIAVSLAGCGGGGSGDSAVSPVWVVFVADKDTDQTFELYAAADDGSKLVKLSGSLVTDGDVYSYYVSPNRQWVAYVADQDTDNLGELYVVPIDGSAPPKKVSGDLGPNGTIGGAQGFGNIAWSPDSTRLTFLADIDVNGIDELYLTDIATGTPVKINGSVGSTVEIGQAFWSPDGRYVAYFVRNRNIPGFILNRTGINVYDATLGKPNSTRVSGSLLSGGTVPIGGGVVGDYIPTSFAWSPDSSRIAYEIDRNPGARELHIARPDGTNSLVNGPLGTNQSLGLRFSWSRDGRYLAYQVYELFGGVIGINTHDTTVGGRDSRRITPPAAGTIADFAWAPNGSQIAYRAQQDSATTYELYTSTPEGSSNNVKISGSIPAGGGVSRLYAWAPNSTSVAYVADQDTVGLDELYVTQPDGTTAPMRISAPQGSDVTAIDWFPTADRLAYADAAAAAFTTRSSGAGAAPKVSGDIAVTGTPLVSPNGDRVAFRGTEGASGTGLYAAAPDGTGLVSLAGTLVNGGNVVRASY